MAIALTHITDQTQEWHLDRHGIIIGGNESDNGSQLLADLLTRARQDGYITYFTGPAFSGMFRAGAGAADHAAEPGDMVRLIEDHADSGAAPAVLGIDIAQAQTPALYEQVRAASNIILICTNPDLDLDLEALIGGGYQMCVASQIADPEPQELAAPAPPQKSDFEPVVPENPEPCRSAGEGQAMPRSINLPYGTHTDDGTRAYWPLTDPQGQPLHGSIIGSINAGKTNLLRILAHQAMEQGITVWSPASIPGIPGKKIPNHTRLTGRIEDYTGTTPVLAISDGTLLTPDPPHPLVATISVHSTRDERPEGVRARMSMHVWEHRPVPICRDPGHALVSTRPGEAERPVFVDHIPGYETEPGPRGPQFPIPEPPDSSRIKSRIFSGALHTRADLADALADLFYCYRDEQVPDTEETLELTRVLSHAYRGHAYGPIGQRLVQELTCTYRMRPHLDLVDDLYDTASTLHSPQAAQLTIGLLYDLPKYDGDTYRALFGPRWSASALERMMGAR